MAVALKAVLTIDEFRQWKEANDELKTKLPDGDKAYYEAVKGWFESLLTEDGLKLLLEENS
jgi:hypothetical protein